MDKILEPGRDRGDRRNYYTKGPPAGPELDEILSRALVPLQGRFIKPYSQKMHFAWELFERIPLTYLGRLQDGWVCSNLEPKDWYTEASSGTMTKDYSATYFGFAETAPHAIALTVLSLVRRQETPWFLRR